MLANLNRPTLLERSRVVCDAVPLGGRSSPISVRSLSGRVLFVCCDSGRPTFISRHLLRPWFPAAAHSIIAGRVTRVLRPRRALSTLPRLCARRPSDGPQATKVCAAAWPPTGLPASSAWVASPRARRGVCQRGPNPRAAWTCDGEVVVFVVVPRPWSRARRVVAATPARTPRFEVGNLAPRGGVITTRRRERRVALKRAPLVRAREYIACARSGRASRSCPLQAAAPWRTEPPRLSICHEANSIICY